MSLFCWVIYATGKLKNQDAIVDAYCSGMIEKCLAEQVRLIAMRVAVIATPPVSPLTA